VARFPTRTLVLMALTLMAFAWFWYQTHRGSPQAVQIELIGDGGPP
jgi:hypothetical protein